MARWISTEETRKCEEPVGGKKFTLSDANRQRRLSLQQADGKIKACVPLLGCSPTGNQEYKICLESCETAGGRIWAKNKFLYPRLIVATIADHHVPHPPAVGQDNGADGEL